MVNNRIFDNIFLENRRPWPGRVSLRGLACVISLAVLHYFLYAAFDVIVVRRLLNYIFWLIRAEFSKMA